MNDPIISVHTPKVAGTSFLQQLKKIYGESKILLDYNDDPVDVLCRMNIDPNYYEMNPITSISPYHVVHGHFHVSKYVQVKNARLITFLRHPIDNVISIYRYWSALEESVIDNPVFKYFKSNISSIERLAMLPRIRFLYSESYFGGIDITQFDFIGDYSSYDRELMRLSKLLGEKFLPDIRINVTSERENSDEKSLGRDKRALLGRILEQDIRFYERYAGR